MSNELAHARFSPSGASRWMRCPGSIALEAEIQLAEEESSSFAAEGTAAHEMGEKAISAEKDCVEYIGQKAENGVVWNEEMAEYVQVYVDNIRARQATADFCAVEQRVEFSQYIDVPDQFGTSDTILAQGTVLEVDDLKYGKGHQVFAEDNEQMMLYALGSLGMFDLAGEFKTVRMTIHQPRLDHLDTWEISVDRLLAFGETAKEAAQNALSDSPRFAAGDTQCRWCKVKAFCKTATEVVAETVSNGTLGFDDLVNPDAPAEELCSAVDILAVEDLEAAFEKLNLVEQWCKAARVRALEEAENGKLSRHKAVLGRRGNRAWGSPDEAEAVMKSMRLKLDDMYTQKVKGPAPIEKLLKEDFPKRWKRIQQLIVQPEGKPTIAPMADKRPAVFKSVEDDFDDFSNDDLA